MLDANYKITNPAVDANTYGVYAGENSWNSFASAVPDPNAKDPSIDYTKLDKNKLFVKQYYKVFLNWDNPPEDEGNVLWHTKFISENGYAKDIINFTNTDAVKKVDNATFVKMLFRALLSRDPETAPANDPYVKNLNNGTSRDSIISQIANSQEAKDVYKNGKLLNVTVVVTPNTKKPTVILSQRGRTGNIIKFNVKASMNDTTETLQNIQLHYRPQTTGCGKGTWVQIGQTVTTDLTNPNGIDFNWDISNLKGIYEIAVTPKTNKYQYSSNPGCTGENCSDCGYSNMLSLPDSARATVDLRTESSTTPTLIDRPTVNPDPTDTPTPNSFGDDSTTPVPTTTNPNPTNPNSNLIQIFVWSPEVDQEMLLSQQFILF